jgi:hypothetical protein
LKDLLTLRPGESIVWEGRPVQVFAGWAMTVLLAALYALANTQFSWGVWINNLLLGLFLVAFSFTLYIAGTTLVSRYFVTSQRLVMEQSLAKKVWDFPLGDLSTVQTRSSFINRRRGVGLVRFEFKTGRPVAWIVKDPEKVRQIAMESKSTLATPVS